MDPLTSFVTIVSLLATFQSGREGKRDIEEFKHWLEENNHSNMVSIIENNNNMQQQLTMFMDQNHDQVMSQLSTLNDLMVSIASHMQGLGNIASSFAPNSGLSEQAVDVLRQFVNSDKTTMHFSQNFDSKGKDRCFLGDAYSIDVRCNEPRFIADDVNNLVNLGLVTKRKTSMTDFVCTITRQAVDFIEDIDNKK